MDGVKIITKKSTFSTFQPFYPLYNSLRNIESSYKLAKLLIRILRLKTGKKGIKSDKRYRVITLFSSHDNNPLLLKIFGEKTSLSRTTFIKKAIEALEIELSPLMLETLQKEETKYKQQIQKIEEQERKKLGVLTRERVGYDDAKIQLHLSQQYEGDNKRLKYIDFSIFAYDEKELFEKLLGIPPLDEVVYRYFSNFFFKNQYGDYEFILHRLTMWNDFHFSIKELERGNTGVGYSDYHYKQYIKETQEEWEKNHPFNVWIPGIYKHLEDATSRDKHIYGYQSHYMYIYGKKLEDAKYIKPSGYTTYPYFFGNVKNLKSIEKIFLVEGNKDMITLFNILHKNGVKNFVIIPLPGINFFEKQLKEIYYYIVNAGKNENDISFYYCLDNDEAGQSPIKNDLPKLPLSIRRNFYKLDWEKAISPNSKIENGDITDYALEGTINLSLENFTPILLPLYTEEQIRQKNSYLIYEEKYKGEENFSKTIENNPSLKEIFTNPMYNLVVQAPTGFGKSHYLINNLINDIPPKTTVFTILPVKILRKGFLDNKKIWKLLNQYIGAVEQLDIEIPIKEKNTFTSTIQYMEKIEASPIKKAIFMEYIERLIQENHKIIFYIDEAHLTSAITEKGHMFIERLAKQYPDNIKIVQITATAPINNLVYRDEGYRIINIQGKTLQFKNIEYIQYPRGIKVELPVFHQIIPLLKDRKKVLVLLNNNEKSVNLKHLIKRKLPNKKVALINKTTLSKMNNEIGEEFWKENDLIITTSITEFGVNFFNTGIDVAIAVNTDLISSIQFWSRLRDNPNCDLKVITPEKYQIVNLKDQKTDLTIRYDLDSLDIDINNQDQIKSFSQKIAGKNYQRHNIANGKLSIYLHKIRALDNQPLLEYQKIYSRISTKDVESVNKKKQLIKENFNQLITPLQFINLAKDYISFESVTYSFYEKKDEDKEIRDFLNGNIEAIREETYKRSDVTSLYLVNMKKTNQAVIIDEVNKQLEHYPEPIKDLSNNIVDSLIFGFNKRDIGLNLGVAIKNKAYNKYHSYKAISTMLSLQYLKDNYNKEWKEVRYKLDAKHRDTRQVAYKRVRYTYDYFYIFLFQNRTLGELNKEIWRGYHIAKLTTPSIRRKINGYIKIGNLLNSNPDFEDEQVLKKLGLKEFDRSFLSEKHLLTYILKEFQWFFDNLEEKEEFIKTLTNKLNALKRLEEKNLEELRDLTPF